MKKLTAGEKRQRRRAIWEKKEIFPRQQRYTKDSAHTLIFFLRKLWEIKAVLNRNGSYPPASDKLTPSPFGGTLIL